MSPRFTKFAAITNDPLPPLGKKVIPPKPEPKPDPIKEFEKLKHEQPPVKWVDDGVQMPPYVKRVKGSGTQREQQPTAIPPSAQAGVAGPAKFKVGDKFVVNSMFDEFFGGLTFTATRVNHDQVWAVVDGVDSFFFEDNIEHAAPQDAQSKPVADAEGWLSCAGDLPDLTGFEWRVSEKHGGSAAHRATCRLRAWAEAAGPEVYEYRPLKDAA